METSSSNHSSPFLKNATMAMLSMVMGTFLPLTFRCSSLCILELGYYCINGGPDGSTCFEACGDGRDELGTHACDDGNLHPDDGCDAECNLEGALWDCTPITFPTVCVEECDGTFMRLLECDGGALCDATCTPIFPADCTLPGYC